eukprot:8580157-Alexandrium_andersonii.AAC.1
MACRDTPAPGTHTHTRSFCGPARHHLPDTMVLNERHRSHAFKSSGELYSMRVLRRWVGGQGAEPLAWPSGLKLELRPTR